MAKFTEAESVAQVREQVPELAINSARLNSFADGQFNALLFVNEPWQPLWCLYR